MFKKFENTIFTALKAQHNIFVLVGNGFDISVLKKFKLGKMCGKTTSYVDFYDYITYFNLSCKDNIHVVLFNNNDTYFLGFEKK